MGKGRHKTFADEPDKGKVRAQSARIKELEKEVRQLRSQIATLESAFKKAAVYMSDESKLLKVEELIVAANKHQSLSEAKSEHIPTEKDIELRTKEDTRKKWAEWREGLNILPPGEEDV